MFWVQCSVFSSQLIHKLHVRQLEGFVVKGLLGAVEAEHQIPGLVRLWQIHRSGLEEYNRYSLTSNL